MPGRPGADDGSSWGILVHGIDLTERWRARRTLRRRARQQAAVAELGREAQQGADPHDLVRSACAHLSEELEVARSAYPERGPESDQLVLVHGRGWPEGAIGSTVPAGPEAPEGRALRDRVPVALAEEEGIPAAHEAVGDRPVASMLAVPIRSRGREPLGVLAAYADEAWVWDKEETDFLQALAHVLGTATAWSETERRLSTLVENLPGILYRCRNDRSWTMEYMSVGTLDLTGWGPEEFVASEGGAYAELIQQEAERSRRLIETTFRSLEDAIFVVRHPERTLEACNPAAEHMFGWDEDELVGSTTDRLHLDAEHCDRFGRESRRALARAGVYRGEHRMRRAVPVATGAPRGCPVPPIGQPSTSWTPPTRP